MPRIEFDRKKIRAGLIVHGRRIKPFVAKGQAIRWALNKGLRKKGWPDVWGNHDALIVGDSAGGYGIGDSEPMRAKINSLEDYEREMSLGNYAVRIFRVKAARREEEIAAADYWVKHINGTFYDFRAYPYLFIKAVFHDYSEKVAGWEWAFWCTEGVARSYRKGPRRGSLVDPYLKKSPTPLTTEKRAGLYPDSDSPVTLEELTEECILNYADLNLAAILS